MEVSKRLKLAYISPMPPLKTGIADYSAELIPFLSEYYDITVIVNQGEVSDNWAKLNCDIRQSKWFEEKFRSFDRVIYHIGNSSFHEHMFDLLEKIPGVVVLHDFYLGHVQAAMEFSDNQDSPWTRELYFSHGYNALISRFQANDLEKVVWNYPVSFSVISNSKGVIVHSDFSKNLARKWYGNKITESFTIIPLLRISSENCDRTATRQSLSIYGDTFLVCSFGILGKSKLNNRLLKAWKNSQLSKDPCCHLVFVGQNHGDDYGRMILEMIKNNNLESQVKITGWASKELFNNYLASADIAVQLRTKSRGETSAAVLDCMNHGVPTIINANGAMADLPKNAVYMMPDEFSDEELVSALEELWQNSEKRKILSANARIVIENQHSPQKCAKMYCDAIEQFYSGPEIQPSNKTQRQLLLDVSVTCRDDYKTGIQRVVRAITFELLNDPPSNYRVEPVYLTNTEGKWQYYYAREYTMKLLGYRSDILNDAPANFTKGDILLCVDLTGDIMVQASKDGIYDMLREVEVKRVPIIYDILPLRKPEYFPPGESDHFREWFDCVLEMDECTCISSAVADDVEKFITEHYNLSKNNLKISAFHLGADINRSAPTLGIPDNAEKVLDKLSKTKTFLMVGTLEPRKGHLQAIKAFSRLWQEGYEYNLVIVGREGWKHLPDEMRRTIPEICNTIVNHEELGRHLFWLDGISDEYLEKVYEISTCLIFASEGEGFGLPLIEAAKKKLPILARDIPVFREIAGDHAYYFSGLRPEDLSSAVEKWASLYESEKHPKSDDMPWQTWKDSARQLLAAIGITNNIQGKL
jgi:glycosyltransferase involved in cell wall biosynthesis